MAGRGQVNPDLMRPAGVEHDRQQIEHPAFPLRRPDDSDFRSGRLSVRPYGPFDDAPFLSANRRVDQKAVFTEPPGSNRRIAFEYAARLHFLGKEMMDVAVFCDAYESRRLPVEPRDDMDGGGQSFVPELARHNICERPGRRIPGRNRRLA